MDNLSEKIMAILNNPEGLESIMSIAKSLGLKDNKKNNPIPVETDGESLSTALVQAQAQNEGEEKPGLNGFDLGRLEELLNHNKSQRLELLKALKPYIKPDKQGKIDNIMNAMRTIDIIYSAKNFL